MDFFQYLTWPTSDDTHQPIQVLLLRLFSWLLNWPVFPMLLNEGQAAISWKQTFVITAAGFYRPDCSMSAIQRHRKLKLNGVLMCCTQICHGFLCTSVYYLCTAEDSRKSLQSQLEDWGPGKRARGRLYYTKLWFCDGEQHGNGDGGGNAGRNAVIAWQWPWRLR